MVIKFQLKKEQFIRLSILYHIQRKQFYFYAFTAAIITAFAIISKNLVLLAVVWIPFLIYLGIGIFGAIRDGSNKDNPVFLPTTYKFTDKGVSISTAIGESDLGWNLFSGWQVIAKNYVLKLKNGSILAIPQNAISSTQAPKFKVLLDKHLKK